MTRTRILNFGSCFAASVAHYLTKVGFYFRVSSVQQNRIDQFRQHYISKTARPLLRKECGIVPTEKMDSLFANQFDDESLGKSLPYGYTGPLMHPVEAVTQGVDVVIIDNFADILFQLNRNPETGQLIYCQSGYTEENAGLFPDNIGLISPEEAVCNYQALYQWVKVKNPEAVFVFLNFPMNLKMKEHTSERVREMADAVSSLKSLHGFGIVELIDLLPRDLRVPTDLNHFSVDRYMQYTFLTDGIIRYLSKKK